MEQSRAINALAPFLALAKSATSPRAASDLVAQATSANNTYVFAELLQTPAIQNLQQDSQYAGSHKLLEIFAWGTWQDYQASAGSLPQLNEVQTHKLRLLTLLTLAARCTSSAQLTYSNLQQALSLSSPRELEALVTDAIYADLLSGTLNPAQQIVVINSVAPLRDLAPGSVSAMVAELEAWNQRCESVLQDLDAEIAKVSREAVDRAHKENEVKAQLGRAAEKYNAGDDGKTRASSKFGVNEDAMDLDGSGAPGGGLGGMGTRRSKMGGSFGFGRKA